MLENDAPKNIDYISIDTEGCEYLILKDFPFSNWNVTAMTVANNFYQDTGFSQENDKNIKKIMNDNGFVLMKRFSLHELDANNWGKKFEDELIEDLYVSKEFFEKKKLKVV